MPLSETIISGLPRRATSADNSRITRIPEIEVSGTEAKPNVGPHLVVSGVGGKHGMGLDFYLRPVFYQCSYLHGGHGWEVAADYLTVYLPNFL